MLYILVRKDDEYWHKDFLFQVEGPEGADINALWHEFKGDKFFSFLDHHDSFEQWLVQEKGFSTVQSEMWVRREVRADDFERGW